MKTPARHFGFGAAFALLSALTLATFAHSADQPAAPPADQPATPPAVAPATTPSAPAAPAATAETPELRRLDVPAGGAPAAAGDKPADETKNAAADDTGKKAPDTTAPKSGEQHKVKNLSFGYIKHHENGNARVTVDGNSVLAQGEEADAVVSIFGSSTAEGDVNDAVVSVLGSSTSSGNVGDAVVSVFGDTRVNGGQVGDAAVAVLGNTYVNGHVRDAAVAVLGDVELGPNAVIDGDVVCVGGMLKRDPHAIVHGNIQNIAIAGHAGGVDWLHAWVAQCLRYARPLAFGPHLMWAWWIALGFLGLYALIALIFGDAVEKCVRTLEQRPGYSLLAALLTVLITPVAITLLCVTVIGIALIPFIAAGLFFATLFGKVVMLAWIGRRVTKLLGQGAWSHAAVATLIGGVIVLLLYTVPVLGFIVYKLLGLLGLGVVVYTLILGAKRKPAPPAPVTAAPLAPGVVADPTVSGGPAAMAAPPMVAPLAVPPIAPTPTMVSAATLVRAGFWLRLASSALDAVIVGLAEGFLPHALRPNYVLLYAAYCVVMWTLKGTTVGGIVCNLKVVRLDDRPVDWMTALVRALSGFLSLFAAGLGFIWVAFDEQKQSWHDKIAGTTVVIVPKGVSLV